MPGELVKDSVIIADQTEASQIYNKGYYGYPMSGGGLEMDLLEAVYLVECGRLEVRRQGEVISMRSTMSSSRSRRSWSSIPCSGNLT